MYINGDRNILGSSNSIESIGTIMETVMVSGEDDNANDNAFRGQEPYNFLTKKLSKLKI